MAQFARAIFDNEAENPAELAFRKGDMLALIQSEGNGWWRCSLNGHTGVAPINRMEVISPIQAPKKPPPPPHITRALDITTTNKTQNLASNSATLIEDNKNDYALLGDDEYHTSSFDDLPASRNSACEGIYRPTSDYDIPSQNNEDVINTPPFLQNRASFENNKITQSRKDRFARSSTPSGFYDRPVSVQNGDEFVVYEITQLGQGDAATKELTHLDISCNNSSGSQCSISAGSERNRASFCSGESLDSTELSRLSVPPIILTKSAALERYSVVEGNLSSCVHKFFTYVTSKWKSASQLTHTVIIIQQSCFRLVQYYKEYIEFCKGVLANAHKCSDKALSKKIWKHIRALEDQQTLAEQSVARMDRLQWDVNKIAEFCSDPLSDYLDQILCCCRNTPIQIRALTLTVKGNASLLFPDTLVHKLSTSAPNNSSELLSNSVASNKLSPALPHIITAPSRKCDAPVPPPRSDSRVRSSTDRPSSYASTMSPMRRNSPSPTLHYSSDDNDYSRMQSLKKVSFILPDDEKLRHQRDNRCLYSQRLELHYAELRSRKDSLNAMLQRHAPLSEIIAESRRLISAGQEIVYFGDALNKRSVDPGVLESTVAATNDLCDTLRAVVRTAKAIVPFYPDDESVHRVIASVSEVDRRALACLNVVSNTTDTD